MSYPVPHFRDPENPTTELRAILAEAALLNLRRFIGRPDHGPILEDAIMPPQLTLPPLREIEVIPALPDFYPSVIEPITCGSPLPGFIPTPNGLLRDDEL